MVYCGDLICENCGFEEENENSFNMVSYDIICNKPKNIEIEIIKIVNIYYKNELLDYPRWN